MHLSDNHIFYTASSDIAEIAKPLHQLNISYFTYMRSYYDGSRLYLHDGSPTLQIYLKQKHYLNGNTECKPGFYKEQTVLWDTLPNQKVIDNCARACGFDHGIFMFHPQDKYCEVFTFATKKGNDRIINTYLSKMDVLTKFKQYFRETASSIIDQAENQKFILPFNNKLDIINAFASCDFSENSILWNTHVNKMLTPRQIECCVLLLKGKSAKEIANSLNLSIRTVEYYLNNIKSKFNCKNKTELILKLSKLLVTFNEKYK